MMELTRIAMIQIPGTPIGKARARVTMSGTFTPKKTKEWERDARKIAAMKMQGVHPTSGPVFVEVSAYFHPSASWPAWKQDAAMEGHVCHTKKPDGDNIAKAATDALNGIVWIDDAQIVDLRVRKRFGTHEHLRIDVYAVAASPSQISNKADLAD